MTKKVYIKDESFDPIYKGVSRGFYARTRLMPSLLVFLGLFVFSSQVVLPLVVFTTQDTSNDIVDNATVVGRAAGFYEFEFAELSSPESTKNTNEPQKKGYPVKGPSQAAQFLQPDTVSNYDPRAELVKGSADEQEPKAPEITNAPDYFYITVPKLGIENAKIETNAKDLNPDTALGHYPGTALPGEVGNAFVFGHSVLPWFYNAKNYKTIFSTLDRLQTGDEFYVTYNNQELTYKVESKEELKPDKVNPLGEIKPKYLNESTMQLMTCSPAGTKLKRLLINAVLVT